MPNELVQENVMIPCSKCGNPTSNIYRFTAKSGGKWDGQELTVCVCSKCGESTIQYPTKENVEKKSAVTCPFCQSTNCKKISGASKIGKVALWGVFAAGAVSKTWHCNNCGSNFG